MQGNQAVELSMLEFVLAQAIDYHMTHHNCAGCLQFTKFDIIENQGDVYFFCCLLCPKTIYVIPKYEKKN